MAESYRVAAVLSLTTNMLDVLPSIVRQLTEVNAGLREGQEAADGLTKALAKLGGVRIQHAVEQLGRMAPVLREASEAQSGLTRSSGELASNWRAAAEAMQRGSRALSKAKPHSAGGSVSSDDAMMASIGLGVAGAELLKMGHESLSPAFQVAHLRSMLMTDRRVSGADADRAVDAADAATKSAPGTTVQENLAALLDLKTVIGSLPDAIGAIPQFAQLDQTLRLVATKNGSNPSFAAAKAMEILGGMYEEVRNPATGAFDERISPAVMQGHLDAMQRVILATNGRIQPSDYLQYAKTARSAGMQFSDEFTYSELPAILQVLGGQRTGTAFMSLEQLYQGNRLTDKSASALAKIGLFTADPIEGYVDPHTGKKRTRVSTASLFEKDLLRTDPVKWAADVLSMLQGRGYKTVDAAMGAISDPQQRATVAGLLADLLKDLPSILKEKANITNTPLDAGKQLAATDPTAKLQQLDAAWQNLLTHLGGPLVDPAISLMNKMTDGLDRLSTWAKANPAEAKLLGETAAGLGVVATAVGALGAMLILYLPVFRLMSALSGAGALARGAGAAAGAIPGAGLVGGALRLAGKGLAGGIAGAGLASLVVPGLGVGAVPIASGASEEAILRRHNAAMGLDQASSAPPAGNSTSNPVHVVVDNHAQVGASAGKAVMGGMTNAASRAPVGSSGWSGRSGATYPGAITSG